MMRMKLQCLCCSRLLLLIQPRNEYFFLLNSLLSFELHCCCVWVTRALVLLCNLSSHQSKKGRSAFSLLNSLKSVEYPVLFLFILLWASLSCSLYHFHHHHHPVHNKTKKNQMNGNIIEGRGKISKQREKRKGIQP